jgi:uncharacterized C2H2 Zn-finger protein
MGTVISEGRATEVRLWNDAKEAFNHLVHGNHYHIPAGQFVVLARREAIEVRGHYPGRGVETRLRIEELPGRDKEIISTLDPERLYLCPKCDSEFESKEDYQKHYDSAHKRVRGRAAERITDNGDDE